MLNKPSPRLQILREQLAREKFSQQNARELYAHSASHQRTTHHTDHEYSYNEDLADWLKSLTRTHSASKTHQPEAPASQPSELCARLADAGGAASGAALVGAKLTHKVCIREHIGTYRGRWRLGEVVAAESRMGTESAWIPCDKDGWIPHTPTADSTCPVPAGVAFDIKRFDTTEVRRGTIIMHWQKGSAIVAWRPVAGGAAS